MDGRGEAHPSYPRATSRFRILWDPGEVREGLETTEIGSIQNKLLVLITMISEMENTLDGLIPDYMLQKKRLMNMKTQH